MTNGFEPQGRWNRQKFKLAAALIADVALLCMPGCAVPDAAQRDPSANSPQVEGQEFSLVSQLADLENDADLRVAGAGVKPNMTFVYKGQHFAKAPDGSIKILMSPPRSNNGGLDRLAPKFQAMTLEERLKADPDYLKKLRDRVPASDASQADAPAHLPRKLLETSAAALPSTIAAIPPAAPPPLGPEWLASGQPNPVDLYVKNGTDYTAYSLSEWQTPVRNQLHRGTCWVFAGTGLLEAAYRHHVGLSLDLSEQFAKHIIYSTLGPVSYLAHSDNASSFWDGGNFSGTFGSALMNNTIPEESYAPYLDAGQMAALITANNCGDMSPANATQAQIDYCEYQESYISMAARRHAFYGFTNVTFLSAADVQNTQTLESFIVGGHEIAVDLTLAWSASTTDPTILDYDPTVAGGGHNMLFVGYDRRDPDPNRQYFIVKNSWGGDSLIKVSYKFVQNATSGGVVANSVLTPATDTPPYRAIWIGQWLMDDDGVQANVTIRRTDEWQSDTVGFGPEGVNTALTRLGQYLVPGGSPHELNGQLSQGDYGMTAYLDTSVTTNAPGTTSGKKIQTWLYRSDTSKAAGYSSAIPGVDVLRGAFLSRAPVAHPGAGSFFSGASWQGTWLLDFSGALETLTLGPAIGGTAKVASGTLFDSTNNVSSPVSLTFRNMTSWMGILNVGGQQFPLYGMSNESGFIAGYTANVGHYYALHATRQ